MLFQAENLTIDLRENTLTLIGDVEPVEGANEEKIMSEFETGRDYRQFTVSTVIDQSKIDANLADGVLRLMLPKVEEAKPRRIEVKPDNLNLAKFRANHFHMPDLVETAICQPSGISFYFCALKITGRALCFVWFFGVSGTHPGPRSQQR
ncbi:MAG: Hsp20/alpha crystallin family protein [Pseudomonadota bacterium]